MDSLSYKEIALKQSEINQGFQRQLDLLTSLYRDDKIRLLLLESKLDAILDHVRKGTNLDLEVLAQLTKSLEQISNLRNS